METLLCGSCNGAFFPQDLIIGLTKRIEKIEKGIAQILVKLENVPSNEEDSSELVNGVNVFRIPSRVAYSYGLQLMDLFFTKGEMASSLLFQLKKSEKPPLDKERVNKMIRFIEKRYPSGWDLKTLTAKVNQKCRDVKTVVLAQNASED